MQSKESFTIRVQAKGDVTLVFIKGALVEEAGVALAAEVGPKIDEGCKRFVIDFGHSLTISSPTVATILDLAERIVDGKGGKLIVSSLTDLNMKVFEMVGIFLYAEACPTVQEAEVQIAI
ncbi:MAG: STAS domain-containing protein [Candidatus Riflebacteria bacterium]|nr:STAS domain-containing protein [Candidatus Riflebacteria bacterium]